jgi:hypothetical protein
MEDEAEKRKSYIKLYPILFKFWPFLRISRFQNCRGCGCIRYICEVRRW